MPIIQKIFKGILCLFKNIIQINLGGNEMAEVSKELQERAYEAIEVAKKTGKIKRGTNEVTKAIERGIAKLVVIAENTNPAEVIMHLPVLCEEKGIPFVHVPSKEDLGAASGLDIPTASIAIVQEGEAREIIKEITNELKRS